MRGNKKKKRIRSYPILILTTLYVVLFVCMITHVFYYSISHKQELINNDYNTRQKIFVKQNERGKILSRDGEELAVSEKDDSGKEVRKYPYDEVFAHAVGYVSKGKTGIEDFANYYLINSNIDLSKKVEYDNKGLKYPGDNVITTFDVDLQRIAYNALAGRRGAVVVTNPKTGEILAMVSRPGFNPNTLLEDWDNMINDTTGNAMLLNRVTQGQYPPGSTFKIVTTLGYLKEHPTDYGDYRFSCSGRFSSEKGGTISCYHGQKHGNVDLEMSFAKSCNSSFANIGVGLKEETFDNVLSDLMFNEELPIDYRSKKSSAGYPEDKSAAAVMQLSIGQGKTSISPMHLNMITCAVANGGNLMKPYVISKIESADGKEVKSYKPEIYRRLMSTQESTIIKGMMEKVVTSGTANKLNGLSYTAAGKTGSAEFNDQKDSHAWFTGFAPADDPQICVTIIVEEAGSGGSYAVPIAKNIFDAYFGDE